MSISMHTVSLGRLLVSGSPTFTFTDQGWMLSSNIAENKATEATIENIARQLKTDFAELYARRMLPPQQISKMVATLAEFVHQKFSTKPDLISIICQFVEILSRDINIPKKETAVAQLRGMERNALKACREARDAKLSGSVEVLAYEDLEIDEEPLKTADDLQYVYNIASHKGGRPTMEDAYFHVETEGFACTGVLDGHGGADVSRISAERCRNRLPELLRIHRGNVYLVFNILFKELQKTIEGMSSLNGQGTTAVICITDTTANEIYVATLGDSEAVSFHCNNDSYSSCTPLSVVRNWNSKKDHLRMLIAPYVLPNPAKPYASAHPNYLLNNSHAIGDVTNGFTDHKHKVVKFPIRTFDKVVIASDGFWDVVQRKTIVTILNAFLEKNFDVAYDLIKSGADRNGITREQMLGVFNQPDGLEKWLIMYAFAKGSSDNVTIATLSTLKK